MYGLFSYALETEGKETFPIQIEGQEDPQSPCYQMTESLDLVFIFHPPNEENTSSFKHDPSQYIWKYEAQFTTGKLWEKQYFITNKLTIFCLDDANEEVTVHGYFNLYDGKKTRLDLSRKYKKENLKWVRFLTFELTSPQQRAWFIPIKGLAFGEPRNLLPRIDDKYEVYLNTSNNGIKTKHTVSF